MLEVDELHSLTDFVMFRHKIIFPVPLKSAYKSARLV